MLTQFGKDIRTYVSSSLKEVVSKIILSFSGLNPLLQQVLVVGVAPGPEGDGGRSSELAAVGVDEDGDLWSML